MTKPIKIKCSRNDLARKKINVFAVDSTAVHKSDEHNIGRLKTQHGTHIGFANGGVNKQKINLNSIL